MNHRIRDETRATRRLLPDRKNIPVLSDEGKPILTSVWNPSQADLTEYYKVPFYKAVKFTGRTFPYVVRNLIQLYSEKGQSIYDPMLGSGTTLYEATKLKRKVEGSDLNKNTVENFRKRWHRFVKIPIPKTTICSATRLPIKNESVNLIIMSFPWFTSWKFADSKNNESMDNCSGLKDFLNLSLNIYKEMYRVLKVGGFVANILGNTYQKGHYFPITLKLPQVIENAKLSIHYQFWNLRVEAHNITFPWVRSALDTKIKKADKGIGWDIHEDIIIARKDS